MSKTCSYSTGNCHTSKKAAINNLSIPSYFVRKYLSKGKASISLIDPKGRPWLVILLCTSRGSFSGGWIAFSLDNNLREGDACMFELVGKCRMRVHIFRS
ncbi:hypothetical protein MRB53_021474 [Persea americana]|uniref:Uncharacterized protein n=1 Tax=Persea americana TaxID=3435 RepID=A0ACC2L3U2_PERAE|nr:hypothetical protein MRB53_021474 [Persea americana]